MIGQYEKLKEGQQLERLQKKAVTKVQLVKYAGASGDFNPLHTDDAFAQSIGMSGVIAHGMLIMGFLGEYVMKLAGTDAEVHTFNMRFGAMTRPGDSIFCDGTVEELFEEDGRRYVRLLLKATKEEGITVGTGKAVLRFF
ncbi:MaoC/PaaZ C-terminal domain-containing protein [Bacillus testis]|uniref:MaoC/PaaZ C-terminal domain-containing protein n=1 Tax=Bacillus testis TaxID=1622072 RepID=UPI00067F2133|nr:MaoC/PaaZ C-terminal domain-containing protein [Bacillus testis]